MYEDYHKKVLKIAKVKYELNEDVLEAYDDRIVFCYDNDFPPSRTVEVLANLIFDLKS